MAANTIALTVPEVRSLDAPPSTLWSMSPKPNSSQSGLVLSGAQVPLESLQSEGRGKHRTGETLISSWGHHFWHTLIVSGKKPSSSWESCLLSKTYDFLPAILHLGRGLLPRHWLRSSWHGSLFSVCYPFSLASLSVGRVTCPEPRESVPSTEKISLTPTTQAQGQALNSSIRDRRVESWGSLKLKKLPEGSGR